MAVGSGRARTVTVTVAVLLLLAVLAGGGYALLHGRGDDDAGASGRDGAAKVAGIKPGVPTIVSLGQLEDLAAQQGPIYWAGRRPGTRYEVTVTTQGGFYVRYLPAGVDAGTHDRYLTVGTYDALNGYDALAAAKKKDADVEVSDSGAVIATFHSAPQSTYFAFPKTSFQVEVFSPVDGEARQLTESGTIALVPGK